MRENKKLHCPGIEPGSQEWESCMIPLHQQCKTDTRAISVVFKHENSYHGYITHTFLFQTAVGEVSY